MQDAGEEKTAKASTQMRYSVQYMAAGTEFVQDFVFLSGTTRLERGAFYAGIHKWFEAPRLGGMAAKGFGLFDANLEDGSITVTNGITRIAPSIEELMVSYVDFIRSEGAEYLSLFDTKKEKKNGKKADKAD